MTKKSAAALVSARIKTQSCALFAISEDGQCITCHLCGYVSNDPAHVQQRFCPNCRTYHEDHVLMQRLEEGLHVMFTPAQGVEWPRPRKAA